MSSVGNLPHLGGGDIEAGECGKRTVSFSTPAEPRSELGAAASSPIEVRSWFSERAGKEEARPHRISTTAPPTWADI